MLTIDGRTASKHWLQKERPQSIEGKCRNQGEWALERLEMMISRYSFGCSAAPQKRFPSSQAFIGQNIYKCFNSSSSDAPKAARGRDACANE